MRIILSYCRKFEENAIDICDFTTKSFKDEFATSGYFPSHNNLVTENKKISMTSNEVQYELSIKREDENVFSSTHRMRAHIDVAARFLPPPKIRGTVYNLLMTSATYRVQCKSV